MGGEMSRAILGWVWTAFALLMVAPPAVRAQVVDDGGLWLALFAQGNLQGVADHPQRSLKWWFDGHGRFLEDADGFNQSIVRPGIGWTLNDEAAAWAGYGWIRTSPIAGDDFDEHRIWQQTTWSRRLDPATYALRSRLEQRFLETGDDVGLRFRQLFRFQHDLPQSEHFSFVTWDELFFHLNDTDWGANNGFDQNRIFVGLGWKHSPDSRGRTEVGYLNQSIHSRYSDDRSHHILSINFYW